MGFEVRFINHLDNTGYQLVIHFRRYSQPSVVEEKKTFQSEAVLYNHIEQRTSDYIYWQLVDLVTEMDYRNYQNDELTSSLLAQLKSDLKYILQLSHLIRCRFIMEHMMPELEGCVPKEDGYARTHLTWAVDELKLLIGFELTWKAKQAA